MTTVKNVFEREFYKNSDFGQNVVAQQQKRSNDMLGVLGTSQFAETCAAKFPPASIRYATEREYVLEGEAYHKSVHVKKGNGLAELDALMQELTGSVFSFRAALETASAECSVFVGAENGIAKYDEIDITTSMKQYTKHQVPQFLARCICEGLANGREPVARVEHAFLYASDSKGEFLFQYYTGGCLALVIATDGEAASIFVGKYSHPQGNRKTKGSLAKALLPLGYQVYQPRTKDETPEVKRALDARAKAVASIQMEQARLAAVRNRNKK